MPPAGQKTRQRQKLIERLSTGLDQVGPETADFQHENRSTAVMHRIWRAPGAWRLVCTKAVPIPLNPDENFFLPRVKNKPSINNLRNAVIIRNLSLRFALNSCAPHTTP